jgi:hypothetical protein
MSKNDNYIYPILVMSNDIIFRGAGGQHTPEYELLFRGAKGQIKRGLRANKLKE